MASSGIRKNIPHGNIHIKSASKISEKRKNEADCIRRYKNMNLNKIQRSNESVAQDKESIERKSDS